MNPNLDFGMSIPKTGTSLSGRLKMKLNNYTHEPSIPEYKTSYCCSISF